MNFNRIISITVCLLLLSCNSKTNSTEFIDKTTGRYLFNSDEVVEVYFNESELYLNWRGATNIKPLKVNDSTFFVKEMNEKIQFLTNPLDAKLYLVFVPKEENDTLQFTIRKLEATEKIPSEYLNEANFQKALEGYLLIKTKDSLDSSINENTLNRIGYKELREKHYVKAINIFKINVALYPTSSNVYDSLADAYMKSGDTLQATENYEKSLKLDSGNRRAKMHLEKYKKID